MIMFYLNDVEEGGETAFPAAEYPDIFGYDQSQVKSRTAGSELRPGRGRQPKQRQDVFARCPFFERQLWPACLVVEKKHMSQTFQ